MPFRGYIGPRSHVRAGLYLDARPLRDPVLAAPLAVVPPATAGAVSRRAALPAAAAARTAGRLGPDHVRQALPAWWAPKLQLGNVVDLSADGAVLVAGGPDAGWCARTRWETGRTRRQGAGSSARSKRRSSAKAWRRAPTVRSRRRAPGEERAAGC